MREPSIIITNIERYDTIMKMTTVYRGYACASAMLGTLPMFYLILPKSHRLLAS